jgi:endogenous inhibitor of DNA gyrase (YacG/DUF329 family)
MSDIKSLVLLILLMVLIVGVILEWRRLHMDQANGASNNASEATELSPLLPFCSPEEDECWLLHRDQANDTSKNASEEVVDATELSSLLPFCSPEEDECWR